MVPQTPLSVDNRVKHGRIMKQVIKEKKNTQFAKKKGLEKKNTIILKEGGLVRGNSSQMHGSMKGFKSKVEMDKSFNRDDEDNAEEEDEEI